MANCAKCGNAIFDPLWGDFKCSIRQHVVYNHKNVECDDYKEGEPTETKREEVYEES